MHIDYQTLDLRTEGDVESKLLIPFVTGELYLGVPPANFFSKDYLAPTPIDKGAKAKGGYFPDFSVWMHAFPVLIIEAKAPGASVEQGYREASFVCSTAEYAVFFRHQPFTIYHRVEWRTHPSREMGHKPGNRC